MLSQETILELMGKGSQHSGMSRLFQSFNQESYDGKGRGESHICEAPFLATQLPIWIDASASFFLTSGFLCSTIEICADSRLVGSISDAPLSPIGQAKMYVVINLKNFSSISNFEVVYFPLKLIHIIHKNI